ncbi:MAG: glutamate--tRNA ligase, partial [Lachnospiraceae bacterium]|nr:glutamate--tRNA ligase [Lachnospiraceae bacterium]
YLLTLLNSNFEEWHEKYPDKDLNEFPFKVEKMSKSGALFDKDKLHDICKNELSKLSEEEMYDFFKDWADSNDVEEVKAWVADKEKTLAVFRLCMGIGQKRRRKDFAYAKQIAEMIRYFFVAEAPVDEFKSSKEDVKAVIDTYLSKYDHNDDNSVWFNKMKEIADELGYASDMKAYKANPENYKGSVADVSEIIRIGVTGQANSPDLWTINHIIGEDEMRNRLKRFA